MYVHMYHPYIIIMFSTGEERQEEFFYVAILDEGSMCIYICIYIQMIAPAYMYIFVCIHTQTDKKNLVDGDVPIQSILGDTESIADDETVTVSSISGLDHLYCTMQLTNTSVLLSIGESRVDT